MTEPLDFETMQTLSTRPLERVSFAPFGDVIEISPAVERREINYGTASRYHDLAHLDLLTGEGRPIVSIFRAKPSPMPIVVKVMERHPLSSQAFIPLGAAPYLVIVAPPGPFDAARLQAFVAAPHQGVNYAAGVWHHFVLPLHRTSDFLVIDRDGPGNNLDEVVLEQGGQRHVALTSECGTAS